MDWALIELRDRFKKAPEQPLYNRMDSFPDPTYMNSAFRRVCWGTSARKWRPYMPGESIDVCKKGRSTHWTSGTTSAIPMVCPGGILLNQKAAEGDGRVVTCITIVDPRNEISEPGDSGAIVLAASNHGVTLKWVGLLFVAETDPRNLNIGYMIPIQHVFMNIEEITGSKVVEPYYDD